MDDDAQEEMEEELEDTEMGYLGMKSDLVASVLLTQLGHVNSLCAMKSNKTTPGALGVSHDKTGRHVVSEI